MVAGPINDAFLAATEPHPHARVTLSSALKTGGASHAYLFHGPRGVGKADAARGFAAALLSEGSAEPQSAYERAMRGSHPDLTWIKPSGAHEMRVDDVAEPVVRGATRTPMEGDRRVFVIERVETMSDEVANRMLKTLEEPAAFAHFLLLSAAPDQVLATVRSRCQAVRFDAVPAETIAKKLSEEGVADDRAISCARLSAGDLVAARELASDEGDAIRSEAGKIVASSLLGTSGVKRPWQSVVERAVAAGEQAEQQELADLEQRIEGFPKGRERSAAQKEGEQAARRASRRARSESLDRSLRIAAMLLRDLATAASGNPDLLLAGDRRETIEKAARDRSIAGLLDAAADVDQTRLSLRRNVAEELTLQAMSFRIEQTLSA